MHKRIIRNDFTICKENPKGCSFKTVSYAKGSTRSSIGLEQHVLLYCQKGHIRITSNLFKEEFLCAGEILFVPLGSDFIGVALSDTIMLFHFFNNNICRLENCILSFLYTHKKIEPPTAVDENSFLGKLPACRQLSKLMEGVEGYISDEKHEPALWNLKHKELIWLLPQYYSKEELQLFFHPMTDEQIPFKSLVLAHYRKAEFTDKLAEMCGYNLYTFRRIFKKEFGVSVHRWLTQKRAELIRYRLSLEYIPFSDIIKEFHFSSAQQFNRFCRDNLKDNPSSIRNKCIQENKKDVSAQI